MARPSKVVGGCVFAKGRTTRPFVTFLLAALITVLVLPKRSSATGFYLAAEKPFGFSWYDLESEAPDSASTGSVRSLIRSQLDFPMDPFRLALGWTGANGSGTGDADALAASVEAWISVGPSFFKMRDQDWVGASASSGTSSSTVLVKISDTYSRAESFLFGGEAGSEVTSWSLFGEPFALGLGAGGARYAYKIYGLDGKHISDTDGGWESSSLPDDLLVGTYATWSLHGVVSLRSQARMLGLDWKARLLPSYNESIDDHKVRKKTIEMTTWGAGGSLEAGRLSAGANWMPYARFEMDRTWGRMRQTFYGDDPGTPENETGLSFGGIRTTVNAWSVTAGMRWFWR
jgi:hypothetical protein